MRLGTQADCVNNCSFIEEKIYVGTRWCLILISKLIIEKKAPGGGEGMGRKKTGGEEIKRGKSGVNNVRTNF